MGHYIDTFFEKEHEPLMEKWEREREQRGIIDETGCRRYTMSRGQLQYLYKQLENFVADCTKQEYDKNKESINAVYALIHKHINSETTN